jgi:hypothetical protein
MDFAGYFDNGILVLFIASTFKSSGEAELSDSAINLLNCICNWVFPILFFPLTINYSTRHLRTAYPHFSSPALSDSAGLLHARKLIHCL